MQACLVQERVKRAVKLYGSYHKAAKALGVDVGYLHRVANGKRKPGPQILEKLGLERETTYRDAVARIGPAE